MAAKPRMKAVEWAHEAEPRAAPSQHNPNPRPPERAGRRRGAPARAARGRLHPRPGRRRRLSRRRPRRSVHGERRPGRRAGGHRRRGPRRGDRGGPPHRLRPAGRPARAARRAAAAPGSGRGADRAAGRELRDRFGEDLRRPLSRRHDLPLPPGGSPPVPARARRRLRRDRVAAGARARGSRRRRRALAVGAPQPVVRRVEGAAAVGRAGPDIPSRRRPRGHPRRRRRAGRRRRPRADLGARRALRRRVGARRGGPLPRRSPFRPARARGLAPPLRRRRAGGAADRAPDTGAGRGPERGHRPRGARGGGKHRGGLEAPDAARLRGPPGEIVARLSPVRLRDWVAVRRTLASVAMLREVRLAAISRRAASVRLGFLRHRRAAPPRPRPARDRARRRGGDRGRSPRPPLRPATGGRRDPAPGSSRRQ